MLTAANIDDFLARMEAAMDRAKGGEYRALNLLRELSATDLDVVDRRVARMAIEALTAIETPVPVRHPEHKAIVERALMDAGE